MDLDLIFQIFLNSPTFTGAIHKFQPPNLHDHSPFFKTWLGFHVIREYNTICAGFLTAF